VRKPGLGEKTCRQSTPPQGVPVGKGDRGARSNAASRTLKGVCVRAGGGCGGGGGEGGKTKPTKGEKVAPSPGLGGGVVRNGHPGGGGQTDESQERPIVMRYVESPTPKPKKNGKRRGMGKKNTTKGTNWEKRKTHGGQTGVALGTEKKKKPG